ncbi:hypothetical protein bpmyx0001_55490 [Bacillus pseudomycoides DSM 12442]|nr:hypothetical protein bpmyx0001_55490 [Bacillus pseudomycoides DSM 12442]
MSTTAFLELYENLMQEILHLSFFNIQSFKRSSSPIEDKVVQPINVL